MRIVGGKSPEPYWLYAVAGALMLGGPVWRYLYVNHYPFGQPEAVVLPLAAALVGAALALLGHRIGGWVEALIFGAILFLFVDLQFDLEKWAPSPVLLGLCLALPFLISARRAVLTCVTLGVFYLASLPRVGSNPAPLRAATPAGGAEVPLLIHVILDEQWGIGGLLAEGDTATAAFLTDFYGKRGFEVYAGAYSRFHYTIESIPGELSLGNPILVDSAGAKHAYSSILRNIPYFQFLLSEGYAIHVYQTSYLDYCAVVALVVSCETQPGNSIANIMRLRGNWATRARLAGRYLLNVTSRAYARLHPDDVVWRRSNAGGALLSLQHVRDAIVALPRRGNAIFVHVLLPHRPIEVGPRCAALEDPSQRIGYENPVRLSDSSWRATLQLAGDQIRCTHQALGEVLDALDSLVGRNNSIVIVQGDHGPRLNQDPPSSYAPSQMSARTLNARFSTLLAIRRPDIPPAYYAEPVPIQDFLRVLVRQRFKGRIQEVWRHYIRGSPTDTVLTDTLRTLGQGDMLWARLPRAPGAADSSAFRH